MSFKTNLTYIITGAIILGTISGCSKDHSEYHYNGNIGNDYVTFREVKESIFPDNNILTVKKADGRLIEYKDLWGEDLILESVDITSNGQLISYTDNDEIGKQVLAKAQGQFDSYIQDIKQRKINKGLENLE